MQEAKGEKQTSARCGRTGHGGGGDGGHRGVSSLQPLELLHQALALQAAQALRCLPWGQERTGVEALAWKLHNFLRLDPATIYKLEAFQMNNLKWDKSSLL